MDVADAAYHTVHDYPGGAEALAVRLGKRGSTLSHEVRPPVGSTAKLGLLDAVKVMQLSGDRRILSALAGQMDCMVVPLPATGDDETSAEHVATVVREFGELLAEIGSALADSRITGNELQRLQASYADVVAAGQKLLGHLAALHEAGKPRAAAAPIRLRETA